MPFLADLHIHSRFSRATSRSLNLGSLQRAAQLKGLTVVGTGDATHPGWFAELEEQLVPAESGLYALRADLARAAATDLPPACRTPVRFVLSAELSSIYKRDGRTRKVHNLVLLPSLEAGRRFAERIARIGNVRSDGRPILGLDSRDLLEIVLQIDPLACLIPAHIWTPWFSMLGSFSGFDSLQQCYADLSEHIFAVETGLSSDPPMNWRLSSLAGLTLVSNSDAHSPEKLGREANEFACELSWPAMLAALRGGHAAGFAGTLEFFPEEGKYHLDGHRKCGQRHEPEQTLALGGLCPGCGKPTTVGVMHRVVQLADRPAGTRPAGAAPFRSLIPLAEIVGELLGQGSGGRGVQRACDRLLRLLGPELHVLRHAPLEEVRRAGSPLLAEALRRMRAGQVRSDAGYDGEYGVIRLFEPGELTARDPGLMEAASSTAAAASPRMELLPGFERPAAPAPASSPEPPPASPAGPAADPLLARPANAAAHGVERSGPGLAVGERPARYGPHPGPPTPVDEDPLLAGLDDDQRAVVLHDEPGPLLVVAGPGTGKTRTLTRRLARLVLRRQVAPEEVLAVTFTVKAAGELRERLTALLGPELAGRLVLGTFHSLCQALLRRHAAQAGLPDDFEVLDAEAQLALLTQVGQRHGLFAGGRGRPRRDLQALGLLRAQYGDESPPAGWVPAGQTAAQGPRLVELQRRYLEALAQQGALDFDGLLERTVRLLGGDLLLRQEICGPLRAVAVDEYQDVNQVQVRLVRLWAGSAGEGLCAIGDPDQAIYGFRGARREHFLAFPSEWPGARILRLQRSYRSTDTILRASRQALGEAGGPEGAGGLWSGIAGERTITIRRAASERAEAEGVVAAIEQALGGTGFFSLDSGRGGEPGARPGAAIGFSDIAVLFRTHALAGPLVEALERSGIPYQLAGAAATAAEAQLLLTTLRGGRAASPPADSPSSSTAAAPARAAEPTPAAALAQAVAQLAGQGVAPRDKLATAAARLLRLAQPGEDLRSLLDRLALLREGDDLDPGAERVSLLTLHAAKGLEYSLVFIVGCEAGLLPHRPDGDGDDLDCDDEGLAEERRLLYVGMTRAKEQLVLSWAERRAGARPPERAPSPFLDSIVQELRRQEPGGGHQGGRRPGGRDGQQLDLELG